MKNRIYIVSYAYYYTGEWHIHSVFKTSKAAKDYVVKNYSAKRNSQGYLETGEQLFKIIPYELNE